MNIEDIRMLRLANQRIGGSACSAFELVSYMGAMQAQDYTGALWSIGLRTGLTQKEVVAAIEARKILRTWPQRGTLHFVSAVDAKWQVGLSAERLIRGVASRHKRLGINESILVKSEDVLTKALRGGKVLSRSQIMETLNKAGIKTKDGNGYHTLWYLSQIGVLVAGPHQGKQQTFTLLEEWVPKSNKYPRVKAISELVFRYFSSHGPATLKDFMWWSGLTSADTKSGLKAQVQNLINIEVEGKEYWMRKGAKPNKSIQRAFLLPGFDEYMLGYKDRSAGLPSQYADKIVPGGNGMFLATIVIDGVVVGTWKKVIKKDRVIIKLFPFQKLSKEEMVLLSAPIKKYGEFLEMPCVVG